MNNKRAWVFLAALVCLLALAAGHHYITGRAFALILTALPFLFGTVTISYLQPFTTAPTALQGGTGKNYNTVTATITTTATGDNSAVITHNFGLAASEISQGWPMVDFSPQADSTTGSWFEASENPNYTVLGSNQLIAVRAPTKVIISAPHSMFR